MKSITRTFVTATAAVLGLVIGGCAERQAGQTLTQPDVAQDRSVPTLVIMEPVPATSDGRVMPARTKTVFLRPVMKDEPLEPVSK